MIESLRTTQIAFFSLVGFSGGAETRYKKYPCKGSCKRKILWNHLWERRFAVPDPRVLRPPDDGFSTPTTEKRIYDWAAQAAQ